MLVGVAPFRAETTLETQRKVIDWHRSLVVPVEAKLSEPARDLIYKLCSDAETRLNADGIKKHAFFFNFDFGPSLRRSKAPYIPVIRHAEDTSNFEPIDHNNLLDWQTKKQTNRLLAQQQHYQQTNRQKQLMMMNSTTAAMTNMPSYQMNNLVNGNQGSQYPNEPVLYEFTFRRFFDEACPSENLYR